MTGCPLSVWWPRYSLPARPLSHASGEAIAAECAEGLRQHVSFVPPPPPPRPLRRKAQHHDQRRGSGGGDDNDAGVVAAVLPWQRCRPRVIALAGEPASSPLPSSTTTRGSRQLL